MMHNLQRPLRTRISNLVMPALFKRKSETSGEHFQNCSPCKPEKKTKRMVDPRHVVSYEDLKNMLHQPQKVIIDVRNPDEVKSTGQIPSSINIPLDHMDAVFNCMSNEQFEKQFQRKKPSECDELIFYCKSGRRSTEALDKALKLGYRNSKTYLGSWNEWSSKEAKKM